MPINTAHSLERLCYLFMEANQILWRLPSGNVALDLIHKGSALGIYQTVVYDFDQIYSQYAVLKTNFMTF